MKLLLSIFAFIFLASILSFDNIDERKNKLVENVHDTANKKNKVVKEQDTVFIKHDSDWSSENLNYVTDTIIFKSGMRRNLLIGTTILLSTHNQFNAKWEYGLSFNKITKSDCQKSVEEFEGGGGVIKDKINSVLSTDSSITVDINIFDNCCYDFLCDISIVDGSIINLIYSGYGTHCDCDCCYGLTYQLTKEKNPVYKKMKSVMINGNRKTIKAIK